MAKYHAGDRVLYRNEGIQESGEIVEILERESPLAAVDPQQFHVARIKPDDGSEEERRYIWSLTLAACGHGPDGTGHEARIYSEMSPLAIANEVIRVATTADGEQLAEIIARLSRHLGDALRNPTWQGHQCLCLPGWVCPECHRHGYLNGLAGYAARIHPRTARLEDETREQQYGCVTAEQVRQ